MNLRGKRQLVYSALIILCSAVGALLGLTAGLWSFLQIAAVVELTYWIGTPDSDESVRSW